MTVPLPATVEGVAGTEPGEPDTMKTKLWTGETPRQYLLSRCVGLVQIGNTPNDAIEMALDGAEKFPDGSPNREALRWWDSVAHLATAHSRFMAEVKRATR